jgi:hypothetical protein
VKSFTSLQKLSLLLILITAGALRFYHFSTWSLSNDELSALSRLQFPDFRQVMKNGVMLDDMHPPGVQAFLYILTSVAGNNVWIVRLPFVIMGFFSVIIFFLLAERWISRKGALAATAVFSSLIFPVLYSQLARPYSPGLLFTLLCVYFLTNIIYDQDLVKKNKPDYKHLAGFILSCVLCMYTHYFAFLFAGIAGVAGILMARPKVRVALLIAALIMFACYIPALKIFLYQMSIGGLGGAGGWLGPPKADAFLQLIFYIFNESIFLLSAITLLIFCFIFLHFKSKTESRFRWLSIVLFLAPFTIAFFYSILKNPVYQHSIMLFSFPYLLIYIFSFFPEWSDAKSTALTIALLIVTTWSTVAEKKIYSTNYFGVFKELAIHASETGKKYDQKNVTYIANVIKPFYINYYHDKMNAPVKYEVYSCYNAEGLTKLADAVKHSDHTLLSYAWSNTANPEEADFIIRSSFPYLVEAVDYFNSGYRLYSKDSLMGRKEKVLYAFHHDFEQPKLENDSALFSSAITRTGRQALHYTSANEYGPAFRKTARELSLTTGKVIKVSAWVYFLETPAEGNLVLQIDNGEKNLLWKAASFKDHVNHPKEWVQVFNAFRINEQLNPDAVISAYIWNSGKKDFYIDDFSFEIIQ